MRTLQEARAAAGDIVAVSDPSSSRECAQRAVEALERAHKMALQGVGERELKPLWTQAQHWLAVGSRFHTIEAEERHAERSVPQGEGDPR